MNQLTFSYLRTTIVLLLWQLCTITCQEASTTPSGSSLSSRTQLGQFTECDVELNLEGYRTFSFSWQPSRSQCKLTIKPGFKSMQVTLYSDTKPYACYGVDRTGWGCEKKSRTSFDNCAQMFYGITAQSTGTSFSYNYGQKTSFYTNHLQFLYCGVEPSPIRMDVQTEVEDIPIFNGSDNDKIMLIRVIIPTLAVALFIIFVAFFVLFAVKWRSFNSHSTTQSSIRRQQVQLPPRPVDPPPPTYDDYDKYPLSHRYRLQLANFTRNLSGRFRESMRSMRSVRSNGNDSPPPTYHAALATISDSNLSVRNETHVNSAYYPDSPMQSQRRDVVLNINLPSTSATPTHNTQDAPTTSVDTPIKSTTNLQKSSSMLVHPTSPLTHQNPHKVLRRTSTGSQCPSSQIPLERRQSASSVPANENPISVMNEIYVNLPGNQQLESTIDIGIV